MVRTSSRRSHSTFFEFVETFYPAFAGYPQVPKEPRTERTDTECALLYGGVIIAKLTSFYLYGYNRLTYARSGKEFNPVGNIEIRKMKNGREQVYLDGRLKGYVKQARTQAEKGTLERAVKRQRIAEREITRRGERAREILNDPTRPVIDLDEFEIMTYEKALLGQVEQGQISEQEAYRMLKEFEKMPTKSDARTQLWNDLKRKDSVKGHPYFAS